MNALVKKILFAVAALTVIGTAAFFYYRTQGFEDVRERGKTFYEAGSMSRALPYLEAAHGMRPADPNTARMLDRVYGELGFEDKRQNLRKRFIKPYWETDQKPVPSPVVSEKASEPVQTTPVLTPTSMPVAGAAAQKDVAPERAIPLPPIAPAIPAATRAATIKPTSQEETPLHKWEQPVAPASAGAASDAMDLQREKAREMTWSGRYDEADRLYAQIETREGAASAAAYERRAKAALQAGRNIAAERNFDAWLALEPDSIEAASGLSDVYARTGRKAKALELCRRIQATLGNQAWIQSKVERLVRETGAWIVESGWRRSEADSGSRISDVRTESGFAGIYRGTGNGWAFHAAEEGQHLYFSDHDPIGRNKTQVDAAWVLPHRMEMTAVYAHSNYTDGLPDTHDGSIRAAVKAWDGFTPSVFYSREDVIDNSSTVLNRMHLNRTGLKLEERPFRRVELAQRFERADYSDGNVRRDFVSEMTLHVLEGPRQLDLFHRYQTYGYEETTGLYFSPDDFHVNEGGFEWRQYREQAAGGEDPDDYYAFRYTANFDVHQQVGHRFAWRGQWQLNRDWAVQAEVWKHVYEHDKIYGETGASVSVNYAFGR